MDRQRRWHYLLRSYGWQIVCSIISTPAHGLHSEYHKCPIEYNISELLSCYTSHVTPSEHNTRKEQGAICYRNMLLFHHRFDYKCHTEIFKVCFPCASIGHVLIHNHSKSASYSVIVERITCKTELLFEKFQNRQYKQTVDVHTSGAKACVR